MSATEHQQVPGVHSIQDRIGTPAHGPEAFKPGRSDQRAPEGFIWRVPTPVAPLTVSWLAVRHMRVDHEFVSAYISLIHFP